MRIPHWQKSSNQLKSAQIQGFGFIIQVAKQFRQQHCLLIASALTFTTLLSLVPLFSVSFIVLSAFPAAQDLNDTIRSFVFKHFVPTSGAEVQQYLENFAAQSQQLSLFGIIFLIITAILLMSTIERAFSIIWHAPRRRQGLATFLVYWAVLTLAPLLMGASIVVSAYILSLPLITETALVLGFSQTAMASLMPFMLSVLTFTFLYVAIPYTHVPIWHGLTGGILAGLLFQVAQRAFVFYISKISTYTLLYGALATIPIFLLWVYISWMIILLGAQWTACLMRYGLTAAGKYQPRWLQLLICLRELSSAQVLGKPLNLAELCARLPNMRMGALLAMLDMLEQSLWVKATRSGRYVVTRNIQQVTLGDLYRSLPWSFPKAEALAQLEISAPLQQLLSDIDHSLAPHLAQPLREFLVD